MLAAIERMAFEALLNRLRLIFLLSTPLVFFARGPSAWPFVVLIVAVTLGSYLFVEVLLRWAPSSLVRAQLGMRALDCLLVLVALHPYHGSLHDAYYDSVYILFVIAAAATHGRPGGLAMAVVAGWAVLVSRLLHVVSGTYVPEVRHLTDSIFYTLFFATAALAVAYLMEASARVVAEREAQWRADLALHAANLAEVNQQLAEALAERDRSIQAREDFIAIASHELKNPLTSLHGTIDLARSRLERDGEITPERARAMIALLGKQSTRLVQLVQRLFDVSRLSTGQLDLDVGPIDLAELVRALVTEFGRANPTYQVCFRGPDCLPATGDGGRLQQVLFNLLTNAAKFSPAESAIEVDVYPVSCDRTRIRIRDHGPGIPPEHRDRVFDRYYQAGPRAGRGLGLGLYLSRQLIEAHGGSLNAEFPGDGGTCMLVELPTNAELLAA